MERVLGGGQPGFTRAPASGHAFILQMQVRAAAGDMAIQVLDTWRQRGKVELYFTHRYHADQRRLGSLTEYVACADVRPVLQELRRMPIKMLTPLEQAVLADEPTAIEQELAAAAEIRAREQKARERSAAIAAGMATGPASWG